VVFLLPARLALPTKGTTTLSASMDISQKTKNKREQGHDYSGRLSHSLAPDILPHPGRLLPPIRSVDDDFFGLVKSEVKVVTLPDIKTHLKMYCPPSV
jgi:hypothetical protein